MSSIKSDTKSTDTDKDSLEYFSSEAPLYSYSYDPIPMAMESIKNLHFQKSTRDIIAMANLERMHANNFTLLSTLMIPDTVKSLKYDSVIYSARYCLPAIKQYKEMANIIAYIFEYSWQIVSLLITIAITSAINPKVVFLQSAEIANLIKRTPALKTILLQIFYYKGMLDYSLLSAFGHLLLETNMFSKVPKVKEYEDLIGAKSILSCKGDVFDETSRARLVVHLIKDTLDRKKIISLAMIINGLMNVTIEQPIASCVAAANVGLSHLVSLNITDQTVVLTYSFLTDEQIAIQNANKPADEQYQIDNITRAIEDRTIISRNMNIADAMFLVGIAYTTKY